jgi:hypothetical protein
MQSGCGCHDKDGAFTASQMGTLERPRYSPGLILVDSDLTTAVNYTRDLNRLLFRSLFGCGVICGLDVTVKVDCDLVVTVNPGLALDGCGDPIHLTGQLPIKLGKRAGVLVDCGSEELPKHRDFWVIACSREKNCAPRSLVCDDECDGGTQTTRTRSGVEISVSFEPPQCGCSSGIFGDKPNGDELAKLAAKMRDMQKGRLAAKPTDDTTEPRRHDPDISADCPPDCGCGTACSCGCCVVLAWVHWFEDEKEPRWRPLHQGVRRFVRPALTPDPKWDYDADVAKPKANGAPSDAEPKDATAGRTKKQAPPRPGNAEPPNK